MTKPINLESVVEEFRKDFNNAWIPQSYDKGLTNWLEYSFRQKVSSLLISLEERVEGMKLVINPYKKMVPPDVIAKAEAHNAALDSVKSLIQQLREGKE